MVKQYFPSSFSENPGKDLYVLAESLGNFTPMKVHLAHQEDENRQDKLPPLQKKINASDEWFFKGPLPPCQTEIHRAAGSFPFFPSASSRLVSSSKWNLDDASNFTNGPANLKKASLSSESMSFPSFPSSWKDDFSIPPKQLQYFYGNWEAFHAKESQLLDQLRAHCYGEITGNTEYHQRSKQLLEEFTSITNSKNKLWTLLNETEEVQPEVNQILDYLAHPNHLMSISQQTSDVAIANRYMGPPVIDISPKFKPRDENGTLIVSAMLFYHADKDKIKPLEGKQEVLQGIRKVPVDKNGQAIFNKLKITEVSSKHRHQAFCIVFTLEEYSTRGKKLIISSIKSDSFYVQSRPNNKKLVSGPKRKGEEFEEAPRKRNKNDQVDEVPPQIDSPESSQNSDASPPQSIGEIYEGNYVDITDLLTLPQKNAAQQLGISESMLCKRFKECTKRKWPYRYLRKIDKVIGMLTETKNGRVPHSDDKQKLARLVEERKECLRPVKIRITVHDKLSSGSSSPFKRSAPPSPASDEGSFDSQLDKQDEIILETLEMLKSQKKPE